MTNLNETTIFKAIVKIFIRLNDDDEACMCVCFFLSSLLLSLKSPTRSNEPKSFNHAHKIHLIADSFRFIFFILIQQTFQNSQVFDLMMSFCFH